MNVELVNTGTELLLGDTINTNAAWIGQRLAALGIQVTRQTIVPDGAVILTAIAEAAQRADVVLVSGADESFRFETFNTALGLLHAGAELVAEEAVDLERVPGVGGVYRAEHVELGAVLLQAAGGRDDAVEDRPPAQVVPVGVVQVARAVEAEPDEVVVLGEEGAPLVVEEHAVGLDGALDRHAGGHAAAFGRACPAEEVEPHQRGLSALPGQRHLRDLLRASGLGDERLHHLVAHAEVAARVQLLLLEEEAVVAAQVAARPGGLGHDVEGGNCVVLHRPMVRHRRSGDCSELPYRRFRYRAGVLSRSDDCRPSR